MIQLVVWCVILSASLADPTDRPETVIRLTVDAMPAPKPALRYLLLPELREMTPGNPIPNYLKCLLDQDFSSSEEKLGRAALKQADRAARMDKPDWQILPKLRTDGIWLLLPDLQKMRVLAQELQGRFRNEVALRRFDDALVTAKTMFALCAHMGEHPTLIGDLVGIAIAFVAIAPLEEMLAQPGCPNLYWALTNLPAPFISLEKGMEGERMFIQAELRNLHHGKPMTPGEIKKLVEHIDMIRAFEPDKLEKTRVLLDARNKDEKYVAQARARLVEYGIREDLLQAFPVDQVILLDEKRAYEVERDEAIKLMTLPTWQALGECEKLPPRSEDAPLQRLRPGHPEGPPRAGPARTTAGAPSARRGDFACMRRITKGSCRSRWPKLRCRSRSIPLRASRSATRSRTAPPTSAAIRRTGRKGQPPSTSISRSRSGSNRSRHPHGDFDDVGLARRTRARRPAFGGPESRARCSLCPLADGSPEAGAQVSVIAGGAGAAPRQPRAVVPPLFRGTAELLLQQGGRRGTQPLPDDAAQGPADRQDSQLRGLGTNASRLGRAARHARLASPRSRSDREAPTAQMPEFRSLRMLAAALQVRFRGEVARKDFDAAIVTAKTMFAFARHLGECPTTEATRLGLAVAVMALDTLEEFVQQPGCPNLYWALTDLPAPLVELRKGLQGERTMLATELQAYRDDAVLSEQELDELIGRLSGRAGFARLESGLAPRNLRASIVALSKDTARVEAARKQLVESGVKPELVKEFAAIQVILLDQKRDFEMVRDEEMKLLGLAPWQIDALGRPRRPPTSSPTCSPVSGNFASNRPASSAASRSCGTWRRCGSTPRSMPSELPASLEAVKLPLPRDPISGKPFDYKLDGKTARLRTPSRREGTVPAFVAALEITIRK